MAKLNANTVLTHPKTGAVVVLVEGDDVPSWATELIGAHLIGDPESTEPEGPKPVEKMTVPELKQYAEEKQIDLGDATKKDEILAAIQAAETSS
jgi:predicted NUDIX family NTP pyrophosphohydrolase